MMGVIFVLALFIAFPWLLAFTLFWRPKKLRNLELMEARIEELEDHIVEMWHTKMPDTLWEALNMSEEEYARWVDRK